MAHVALIAGEPCIRAEWEAGLSDSDHRIVGCYASWQPCVTARDKCDAQVIVVRCSNGVDTHALRVLGRALPSARLLVIGDDAAPEPFFAALDAGASGYYTKDVTSAELRGAIDELMAGHMPIASSLTPHLVRVCRVGGDDAGFALTSRERDVLQLLVRGHSYGGIALALDVELTTVQTHIRNLYRKLGVASKAEAATLAARHRLVV